MLVRLSLLRVLNRRRHSDLVYILIIGWYRVLVLLVPSRAFTAISGSGITACTWTCAASGGFSSAMLKLSLMIYRGFSSILDGIWDRDLVQVLIVVWQPVVLEEISALGP